MKYLIVITWAVMCIGFYHLGVTEGTNRGIKIGTGLVFSQIHSVLRATSGRVVLDSLEINAPYTTISD